MIYGYARVSTDGQSVDAQVRQLTKAGCKKVFRETASGAKTDRAELRKALAKLEADDVLMVTRLDQLARSTRDLLNRFYAQPLEIFDIVILDRTRRAFDPNIPEKTPFREYCRASITKSRGSRAIRRRPPSIIFGKVGRDGLSKGQDS
jgi:hypothetical protein